MTLHFDPETAEVVFHDAENLVAKRGEVVLLVSRRPMKLAQLKELAEVIGARGLRPEVPCGAYVTVIEESSGVMSPVEVKVIAGKAFKVP